MTSVPDPFVAGVHEELKALDTTGEFHFENRANAEQTLTIPASRIPHVLGQLKDRHGFQFLMDVAGVDWPNREKRFDVVYHLYNDQKNSRVRVKAAVAEGEAAPSVSSLWKGAIWHERETYDMFGIRFDGHPDLRRILCHEEFVGYPLRKDYPADYNQPISGAPLEHIYERDRERLMRSHNDDLMWINIGPAHPVTHGTLRFMAVIDGGEVIRECDTEIGYLHRCFEKMSETHNYNQVIPYTDRLNYCSAPMNNNCWAMTIEKMLGVTVPARVQVIRMMLDEFSRIIDHIVCLGTNIVDTGAISGFMYVFHEREQVYRLFEKLCGARLTVSLTRIGGLGFDLPEGWLEEAEEVCKSMERTFQEFDDLAVKNRIVIDRTKGVGELPQKEAISYGFTGPCLRATGYPLDLRKANPYYFYNEVDFDIPIGLRGDTYDRILVRMEEMRQSLRIIRWCIKNMPSGPIKVDDKLVSLPDKKDVYGNIEGLMNHFMLIIRSVQPPPGEAYFQTEAANGELGFYVVSDGSGVPYRVKCRAPCFSIMGGFAEMVKGNRVADLVAALGSINIIAGELDR